VRAPAEEGLLLGALLDAQNQGEVLDGTGLVDSDFLDPRVRLCWGLVSRLVARRRTVDAVGLFTAAKSVNLLREDDLEWLIACQSSNQLKGEALTHAAEDFRRKVRGREIADQLEQAAANIRRQGLRPAELSGTLEGITHQLTRNFAPDELTENDVVELVDAWEARERGETEGGLLVVPSYLKVLDEILKGFVPGLNMILGDPGIGKSAVIAAIMEAELEAGLRVGFFGLEEGYRWMTKRLLARDLKMAVGDVGIKTRTPEQKEKTVEAAQRLYELYRGRFMAYKFDGVGIDEICRRSTHWILNKGAQIIFIDHIGEIRHKSSGADGYNWAVADSYRRLRDLGFKRSVPIVALAHRKPESRERPGPPRANDIGLTGEAEKMVRRLIGLWRKKDAMRATVIKNNEGQTDITCELARIFDAALVERDGGRIVNLGHEAREEREAEEAKALERGVDRAAERKRIADQKYPKAPKPEKAPKASAQAPLLEVPASSKPKTEPAP
jgi:replicative DNA helicase